MAKVRSKVMKIDEELANQIEDFARKNEISIRQASKEIAKINISKMYGNKILKEIRF